MTDKQPIIDFEPAPGYLLVSKLNREDVAALYNRTKSSGLALPDNVGKVSDAASVGKVVKLGGHSLDYLNEIIKARKAIINDKAMIKDVNSSNINIEVGDYVAFMPYSDLILEIDGVKYGLLEYKSVRAVRKAA